MHISEIRPFVRFARYFKTDCDSHYPEFVPVDARLFYVMSGEGAICLGQKQFQMRKGSVLLIPPGQRYHLETPEQQAVYLALNFDYTFSASDKSIPIPPEVFREGMEQSAGVEFEDSEQFDGFFYAEEFSKIENVLVKLVFEYTGRLMFFEEKASAYLLEVLSDCIREKNLRRSCPEGTNFRIHDVIAYLQEHFAENITNKTLSEQFHFHPNYLSSMVKLYTGMPLHSYLLHVRIANAIDLLETTSLPIGEISAAVGFYDHSYFTKYFKRLTGNTPNHFRQTT